MKKKSTAKRTIYYYGKTLLKHWPFFFLGILMSFGYAYCLTFLNAQAVSMIVDRVTQGGITAENVFSTFMPAIILLLFGYALSFEVHHHNIQVCNPGHSVEAEGHTGPLGANLRRNMDASDDSNILTKIHGNSAVYIYSWFYDVNDNIWLLTSYNGYWGYVNVSRVSFEEYEEEDDY